MSNDSELSFDNINILNPFTQIKQTQIPITFILIMLILIYLIITLVFKFKIAIHQELNVIYIKYSIITNRCEVYNARSISHNDGKLLIDNLVAKCNNRYFVISNFKTEIFNNYGT